MEKIYDITTTGKAFATLLSLTDVPADKWLYCDKEFSIDDSVEMVQSVVEKYGTMPPTYEDWNFQFIHVTTSSDGCKSIGRYGLLDLQQSYECKDSELRKFLETHGIIIDIENHTLEYADENYDIGYDEAYCPPDDTIESKEWSVGRKFYYDYACCGFLSIEDKNIYGGYVNWRPEILYNIDELLNTLLSDEWKNSHKPYEVHASVKGSDIIYRGSDNDDTEERVLNYLSLVYDVACTTGPFEECLILKNGIQVPRKNITDIKPLSFWK